MIHEFTDIPVILHNVLAKYFRLQICVSVLETNLGPCRVDIRKNTDKLYLSNKRGLILHLF